MKLIAQSLHIDINSDFSDESLFSIWKKSQELITFSQSGKSSDLIAIVNRFPYLLAYPRVGKTQINWTCEDAFRAREVLISWQERIGPSKSIMVAPTDSIDFLRSRIKMRGIDCALSELISLF